jgi:hypothetical protein
MRFDSSFSDVHALQQQFSDDMRFGSNFSDVMRFSRYFSDVMRFDCNCSDVRALRQLLQRRHALRQQLQRHALRQQLQRRACAPAATSATILRIVYCGISCKVIINFELFFVVACNSSINKRNSRMLRTVCVCVLLCVCDRMSVCVRVATQTGTEFAIVVHCAMTN